ncbi:MAG: O-methyltransferase [Burkholderiales bacterium]|jgi:acetylserotonin N-methyltransferase|nr:O-methyltransferase [Burkholderiales bacterium]
MKQIVDEAIQGNFTDKYLIDLWLSRYHMAAVAVGDTVGIFEAAAKGIVNITQLANMLELEAEGVEALTCLLASLGLLNKHYSVVSLTETAKQFLLKNSFVYWGNVLSYTRDTLEYKVVLDAIHSRIIQQSTQISESGNSFSDMWSSGNFEISSAKKFINIMNSTIFVPAMKAVQSNLFNDVKHLLDIGGGSGCFASLFIKKYPHKKATIFEIPQVCDITKSYLKKWRTISQIQLHPGNFFKDEFPYGIDAVLFSNILHDWPIQKVKTLIDKVFNILPNGGRIFIHEMLLNEERNGPLNAAAFNLFMYANYKAQQFTRSELFLLLERAGFYECVEHKTHQDYSIITAIKPSVI